MDALKTAMRAKDEVALRTLRAIKAAILVEKTAVAGKDTLTEDEEMKLLQKMAKQRKDSFDIFTEQNRPDLAIKEKDELEVIANYLPQPFTQEELIEALKAIITQVGAQSPADIGKVMGAASKQLAGKADGKEISAVAKQLLS